MKPLLASVISLFLFSSCVFEAPFESEAKFPTDSKLLGRWEEVPKKTGDKPGQMLVLQHSANEYVVEYPVGEEAMYFRAFAVELAGEKYIQVQLIGSADEPVAAEDRKYHLLKLGVDGDSMEMKFVNADLLGEKHTDSARMKAAFTEHKDDPKLFPEASKFRRVK